MTTRRRERRERIVKNGLRRAVFLAHDRRYYAQWYAGVRVSFGKRYKPLCQ
jgi:hypothetical protein